MKRFKLGDIDLTDRVSYTKSDRGLSKYGYVVDKHTREEDPEGEASITVVQWPSSTNLTRVPVKNVWDVQKGAPHSSQVVPLRPTGKFTYGDFSPGDRISYVTRAGNTQRNSYVAIKGADSRGLGDRVPVSQAFGGPICEWVEPARIVHLTKAPDSERIRLTGGCTVENVEPEERFRDIQAALHRITYWPDPETGWLPPPVPKGEIICADGVPYTVHRCIVYTERNKTDKIVFYGRDESFEGEPMPA